MAEQFFAVFFNALAMVTVGAGVGVLLTWFILDSIQIESNLPQTLLNYGPKTLKRSHTVSNVVTITLAPLLLIELWLFVNTSLAEGFDRHISFISLEGILFILIIALVFVLLLLGCDFRTLLCPNCKTKIPVYTDWKCAQCKEGNPRFTSYLNHFLFPQHRSQIGGVCWSCGEEQSCFICTFCREPIYFTDEKMRQVPEKCAQRVGVESVLEEDKNTITEAQQKGEAVSFVESWFTSESDIAHARTLKNKLLAEKKLVMTPEEYERFKEIIEGAFNHKVTSIRTGRGKRR